MIESKDEFNDLLNRLKAKDKENKLGKSLQTKLQAFLEVEKLINLPISGVVNCVYVVTERDNYGEQLFKGVFANKEKAVEYLAEDGLKESNIDEINEIELNK